MKKIFSIFLFSIFFSLFCITSVLHAQESDKQMKLRLAQEFEESGEWERAAVLYEDLYKSEPDNFNYMNGLQNCYAHIKEYDKAVDIIHKWLKFQPNDVSFKAILGGLYYESGKDQKADSVWRSILAVDPLNVQLYRIIAVQLMEHRLFEKSIGIYLEARSKIKNETLFADELGSIYTALQQYASATKEYLKLVKIAPEQLGFAQSRLSIFTSKPEALKAATEVAGSEVKNFSANIGLHRMYAWLLMEDRKYRDALEEYRTIDRIAKANGNELFNFAQRLSQEHVPAVSADAFMEFIEEHKNSPYVPNARFGYARALEDLCDRTDESESHPTYQEVIKLYESLTSQNPDLNAQVLFRIGVIKSDKLFDLNGALEAFSQITKSTQLSNIVYEATLKIGEVQTLRNNLAEARREYEKLVKIPFAVYRDQAAFKLAEIDYFEGQFDTSLSILKQFNTNLGTDLTNDALQLQYFIQENKSSTPQALKDFVQADLLMRQRKFSESLVRFKEVVKLYSTALLVDDAMMKIGELYMLLQQPNESIAAFSFIEDSIQLSILKDRALFRIAEIYQTVLKNKDQAISVYEKLLAKYPNSLYAEESRKRIRLLRGDSI